MPQFISYSDEQGLVSNAVWFIAEDDFGRMYFATDRGLEQFDASQNLWRHFNSKNGLSADYTRALTKDRKGNIWICTASGLTRFNPKAEHITNKPPPIYLSRVRIAGDDLPITETGANEIPLIELQATRNNLTIEFVGLNFTGEDNLSYQYKLEGSDVDWSVPTKQRDVNYARLASGNYRFLVRAVNREGVRSITPASFEFRILPPFYLRWWFIALCVLVVGSFTAVAYRYRVSRLLELERMRTRIATDLHDDIGANLTRISLLSEVAKQESGNGKMLSSIANIARESVASMNDIVWAIAPEHDRLLDLTRRMRQHAEEVFVFREIDLQFNAPSPERDLKLSVGARRDLLLIFKEAVNNAARHSDCSQVAIDFLVEHSVLRLQIKDNGKGIDTDLQAEGQGLRSMKRRAAALGGKLEIDSQAGEGTTVRFELPLEKASRV
jgi:signal transduction histidine kinase